MFDYVREVVEDEVDMDVEHYHLTDEMLLNPEDLIDQIPEKLLAAENYLHPR